MAILVTGGAGYIGSHTTVELLNAGYEVVIVDDYSNSKPEVLNRIKEITGKAFSFHEVNILDKPALEKVFQAYDLEAVIHFAGYKAVGESVAKPLKYYHNNLTGTFVLAELMAQYNVKKIVFSSSATVYGMNNTSPLTEDLPLSTTNPYGTTKMMIEQILQDVYKADNTWSIALLRYFNPIGAHESGRIGEDPNGIPNNLMPFITQVAVGKREKLSIFGDDYDTPDGTGVRDYIHVVDLAKGHLKAVEKVLETEEIQAYNLGTGMGYSVLDVVNNFEEATGQKVPYIIMERRPGDIGTCYSDATKAAKELHWTATHDLKEMCRDSWKWQSENPKGYE
ncbi:UDP-galactose 4-epimerase [Carnobacterium iners]|uniref:UDP-glucose 4-epimerase n=1 Tax=Carnobacterium iners TaxID=1073423 RepID=A0A1X7N8H7_9LACT|nr:UDP-glucose 4-epimerase GalE [Carnobacterium iners]SEL20711.1 UDP-galactose 4-epimerase [Carnobacterium iners]SMH33811.1 UDP-galactose 4-epimerase [Carnobacterium iners]